MLSYNKLITINFVRGHGGEFFNNLLYEAIYGEEIKSNLVNNRYNFDYFDLFHNTNFNYLVGFYGTNYSSFEDYLKYEKCYNKELIPLKRFEKILNYYYQNIKDESREKELNNLKKFCKNEVYNLYRKHLYDLVLYTFSFIHYNNFTAPLGYFFPESKNINLINTKIDEYFFTLLYVYKKSFEVKYYPYINFYPYKDFSDYKKIPCMTKEELIAYFKFKKTKEYKVYDNEIGIESFDFFYNNLNIDEILSDKLNLKIKLNYDKVKKYAKTNRSLMIDIFDYDVYKSYDEEYVYDKTAKFIDRIYDEI